MRKEAVTLDGAAGEGGGQVLRSALSLSMITGRPLHISNIRARRKKTGLLRQHLTAVRAAQAICGARVGGAELGSAELWFTPDSIRGGDYRFDIGTAGSTTLVLQTIAPALWFADAPARIEITGGTHNPLAPSADFIGQIWLPLMRQMGVSMTLDIGRYGFFPVGGGSIVATTRPVENLQGLDLCQRGQRWQISAEVILAGDLPGIIMQKEMEAIKKRLPPDEEKFRHLVDHDSPGNVISLTVRYEYCQAMFTAHGEKRLSSQNVANIALNRAIAFMQSEAAVEEHLCDQLLLPLGLAGNGELTAQTVSDHSRTNMAVIEAFLPVRFQTEKENGCWRISVRRQ